MIGVNDAPTVLPFTEPVADGGILDLTSYVLDADDDALNIVSIPPTGSDNLNTAFGGYLERDLASEGLVYTYTAPAAGVQDFLLFKADDGLAQSNMAFGTIVIDTGW